MTLFKLLEDSKNAMGLFDADYQNLINNVGRLIFKIEDLL